jgi:response regulator RpfG family c-di-GMP phosphodiesterase
VVPDAIRIILSGTRNHAILSAVNNGGIHKYLTKPWNDEQLRLEIKSAFELYHLAVTNRELQETLRRQNEKLHVGKTLAGTSQAAGDLPIDHRDVGDASQLNSPAVVRHSDRVERLCGAVGEQLQWSGEVMGQLDLAARLHDVGNLAVDSRILLKKSSLDAGERCAVQQHAVIPEQLLSGVPGMEAAVQILRSHHENFDGSGYPDGLSGTSIPRSSQILHLADAYEALCSQRSYRDAVTPERAMVEIERGAGRVFDPMLIEPFNFAVGKMPGLGGS